MKATTQTKITMFEFKGDKAGEFTIDNFVFRKDGVLCKEHSILLQKGMKYVTHGGAMFIERVWKI
uniref:Uncharacterized protein n=1 Tax=viral metagenome TaxID=1070528 RepID=A0A6H2A5M4_9ZZZZ